MSFPKKGWANRGLPISASKLVRLSWLTEPGIGSGAALRETTLHGPPGPIEEMTGSIQQRFRGKRFLNEEESFFRIIHTRWGGFPGNEDQRNGGTVRSKRDGEIRSRHARHPDVGDHQIDPAAPGTKNLQRFQSITSFENLKVDALQNCFDVRADPGVIVYNQHPMTGDVVSHGV